METFTLATLIIVGAYLVNSQQQRRRIARLASHLGNYQIEKLMESLTEGYLRCLGEDDPQRRQQIWQLLERTEEKLASQFNRFAAEFAQVGAQEARMSKLPLSLPFALQLLPAASFDARQLFAIHARGIAGVIRNEPLHRPKDKAFMLSAELFLMQHSCHWYCKSKAVASARLLARHKTSYEQVLHAVSPETLQAYRALTGQ